MRFKVLLGICLPFLIFFWVYSRCWSQAYVLRKNKSNLLGRAAGKQHLSIQSLVIPFQFSDQCKNHRPLINLAALDNSVRCYLFLLNSNMWQITGVCASWIKIKYQSCPPLTGCTCAFEIYVQGIDKQSTFSIYVSFLIVQFERCVTSTERQQSKTLILSTGVDQK